MKQPLPTGAAPLATGAVRADAETGPSVTAVVATSLSGIIPADPGARSIRL